MRSLASNISCAMQPSRTARTGMQAAPSQKPVAKPADKKKEAAKGKGTVAKKLGTSGKVAKKK